jgi:hypothetical protein
MPQREHREQPGSGLTLRSADENGDDMVRRLLILGEHVVLVSPFGAGAEVEQSAVWSVPASGDVSVTAAVDGIV